MEAPDGFKLIYGQTGKVHLAFATAPQYAKAICGPAVWGIHDIKIAGERWSTRPGSKGKCAHRQKRVKAWRDGE